jgi:transposase-like protein
MKRLDECSSLLEVFQTFGDEERCKEYLKELRWSNTGGQMTCPRCESFKIYKFKDGKKYSCGDCLKQFTITVGTIFEGTKAKLTKWFAAIYLLTSRKKGISSVQLSKDIGVTQKTAWFMLQRIRGAMKQPLPGMIEVIAEVDETYIGGKEKNKPKKKRQDHNQGRSTKTRTAVAGVLSRTDGKVWARKIQNATKKELHEFIGWHVFPTATIMTDEWRGYNGLERIYDHQKVRHKKEEYVRGECHTNGIEGFWSILKRGIIGVYHSISRKHLNRYLDEFCFRYNNLKFDDVTKFYKMFRTIDARLRYKDLISSLG